MWWHADNSTYGWLLQGFATSDNITGPYTFVDATAPLGNWSQDFGLFTDYKDGRSYALYSNGDSKYGRDVYLTAYNKNVSACSQRNEQTLRGTYPDPLKLHVIILTGV